MWQRQATALRPLGAGERLDVAIKIVRRSFLTFAKAALAIAVPSAIVVVLVLFTVASSIKSLFSTTTTSYGTVQSGSGDFTTIFGGLLVLYLFFILVTTLISAVAFRIVGNAYLGQVSGWREAVVFGLKRIHSVIWVELLVALAIGVAEIPVVLVSAGVAASGAGDAGAIISAVLIVALYAAQTWFFVATSLAIPTVMLEGITGTKALRRSISLCRRNWWTTFGTLLLAYLLSYIAGIILFFLLLFLVRLIGGGVVLGVIGFALAFLVFCLVIASFLAAILVVITIDLRVRKEGFDIQHLAAQMGTTPTSAALSFMPAAAGTTWGYGMPGGPGYGMPGGPGGPGGPGYGMPGGPGGPGGPGYGGYPSPGWQPGGGYPGGPPPPGAPPGWGQPPQGAQPPQGGPPNWGQPPQPPAWTPGQPNWGQPPQPPGWQQPQQPPAWTPGQPNWGQPPGAQPSFMPGAGQPTPAEGAPLRPLPPFRPRDAEPAGSPEADAPAEPPTSPGTPWPPDSPPDPGPDS